MHYNNHKIKGSNPIDYALKNVILGYKTRRYILNYKIDDSDRALSPGNKVGRLLEFDHLETKDGQLTSEYILQNNLVCGFTAWELHQNNKKIADKPALLYACEKDLKIHGFHSLVWAMKRDQYINSFPAICYWEPSKKKLDDPGIYLEILYWERDIKKLNLKQRVALFKFAVRHDILIHGDNPIEFCNKHGIKFDGMNASNWLEAEREIERKNIKQTTYAERVTSSSLTTNTRSM